MSAWICSDEHISSLVDYAYTEGLSPPKCPGVQNRVFGVLQSENVKSVKFRYRNSKDLPGSVPGPYLSGLRVLQHAEAATLADSLDYQSCEHPGWKGSAAKVLCNNIVAHAESNSTAADREKAPWSI